MRNQGRVRSTASAVFKSDTLRDLPDKARVPGEGIILFRKPDGAV